MTRLLTFLPDGDVRVTCPECGTTERVNTDPIDWEADEATFCECDRGEQ